MGKLKPSLASIIALTRLNNPAGFLLLMYPCLWGLALNKSSSIYVYLCFIVGAILMRSAGCIINDILDRGFDKKVERTKTRPLACGQVSVISAAAVAVACCVVSLTMSLFILPDNTILLCILWSIFAGIYPLFKRFTYFPQYMLGVTFNGVIIAASTNGEISIQAIILYIATIFWICGYDSIYAISDYQDDMKAGVKSPVILFKDKTIYFICFNYIIFITLLGSIYFVNSARYISNLSFILIIIHLITQIYLVKYWKNYQKIFKSNIGLGLINFIGLYFA
ncbi:UbiA family prenyltransferase [Rickettsiales endosymbiont of Stachyamoeba lipophora]|uniref:UbiA family prenyltransferase n=1 Tax=Rickettsiales endosymbiont of Stachyamoeba lipophora TaxID=2486578 RepID=UPI000F64876E|nr:UbiA family prenyltransferase [Rickettsiales endosymbiont of Stachyamoeba lipophora]AZL15599.1 4-hydroxybenzoate octaprenyltransferase [Rickettsiales endosymbiont of Stachyamoeba lipophora]